MLRYLGSCTYPSTIDVAIAADLRMTPEHLFLAIETAKPISRTWFRKAVDCLDLDRKERTLGYYAYPAQGMTMAGDPDVKYYASRTHPEPFYFFRLPHKAFIFADSFRYEVVLPKRNPSPQPQNSVLSS